MLTAGIAVVQVDGVKTKVEKEDSSNFKFLGLVAVMAACIISGLAGVW